MKTFSLQSIELDSFCGASIAYCVKGEEGPEDFKTRQRRIIHPDLASLFVDGLRERVTWILGFPPESAESVLPVGVLIPSKGYAVFTALVTGPVGTYKVKTPKVRLDERDAKIVEQIESEADQYINFRKGAQMSLFGDE